MNWVDIVIIIIFVISFLAGVNEGFIVSFINLIGLIIGLVVTVVVFPVLADLLNGMGIMPGWANLVAFAVVFGLTQAAFGIAFTLPRRRITRGIRDSAVAPFDRILGPFPHIAGTVIAMSFFLAVLVLYPVSNVLKASIERSSLGSGLASPAISILRASHPPTSSPITPASNEGGGRSILV